MKLFLILIIMIFLSACSGSLGSLSTSRVDLDGSAWVLTAINNETAIVGNPPGIKFEGDHVTGNASCNTFGGSYRVQGGTIRFGPLARTEMNCMEPEGVMDQEQTYLDILGAAQRFELIEDRLTLYSASEKTLTFQSPNSNSVATNAPLVEQPSPAPPTITPAPVDPTPIPTTELPAGFKEYRDVVTGVSLSIPENWTVTGVIDGEYAIIQSYPEDKYVGGEGRDPGDTKCDLNIRPTGSHASDLIQQWQSSSVTTIVSEDEIFLNSGLKGQKFVIDSMGQATVFITELNQRAVILTCYGDFTLVDEIAATMKAIE